jgi:hypothetical protein
VKVIDANHARFEQTGTVAMVSPEGYHVLPEAEQQDEQIAVEFERVVDKIMDRHGVPRA